MTQSQFPVSLLEEHCLKEAGLSYTCGKAETYLPNHDHALVRLGIGGDAEIAAFVP